ncbi:virB8 family protein [Burkholderia pyrrocinia]|uniref:virB8 family protein n=1 Tax=Burkholderia pyrrocinia TaxID=60550 RepID=UPI001BCC7BA7|nr:type IV secretion system protein [Burkholderia pyrrocinia]
MRDQSERRAWRVAVGACAVAIACAAALAVMTPFYRNVPIPIEVDKLTGDAQVLDVLDAQHVPVAQVIDKHWLTTYVQMRERYYWPFLQMDYDAVRAMSDGQALKDYDAIYTGPNSLDQQLGADVQRRIKILATTLPPGEPGRAVVRFMRTTTDHGETGQPTCFVATIAYRYQPKILRSEKDATTNPLGFKVTAYSRDADYGFCGDGPAPTPAKSPSVATSLPVASSVPAVTGAAGASVRIESPAASVVSAQKGARP